VNRRFKRKRERAERLPERQTVNLLPLKQRTPERIYRFFHEERYADALVDGFVWLSTLEECRRYEDSARGDREEGTLTYNTGTITADGDDPTLQLISQRCGIHIGPGCTNITLWFFSKFRKIPDAWLLCTTEAYAPENMAAFGKYCVEITSVATFFDRLTSAIRREVQIREGAHGAVRYTSRTYRFDEPEPGALGFVKPPDVFAKQREYRMVWLPLGSDPVSPRGWNVNDIRSLVRRLT
jgi:hypothetical protein